LVCRNEKSEEIGQTAEDVQKQLGDFIFAILEKINEAGGRDSIAGSFRTSFANAADKTPVEPSGNQLVAAALANLIANEFQVSPKLPSATIGIRY
jgi:hypothetical protein